MTVEVLDTSVKDIEMKDIENEEVVKEPKKDPDAVTLDGSKRYMICIFNE